MQQLLRYKRIRSYHIFFSAMLVNGFLTLKQDGQFYSDAINSISCSNCSRSVGSLPSCLHCCALRRRIGNQYTLIAISAPPPSLPLCPLSQECSGRGTDPDFCWQRDFLVCVVILCNERLRLGQFVLFIFSWHCLTQTLKNSPLMDKWRGVYQIKSEQDSWQIKSKNFPILSLSMHRIHTHTKKPPCQSLSVYIQ